MPLRAHSRWLLPAGLCVAVLLARRWDQLAHPQIWDEDGTIVVRGLIVNGASSLAQPINGYLVTVSRLISALALAISPTYYPLLSTVVTWTFTAAVIVAISVCPLIVRGGWALALAALLVPSDPEVFGLPIYALWWAGLLIAVAALWRVDARGTLWRIAFVLIGGLSTPFIIGALPVFLYRAARWRDCSAEVLVAAAAGAVAALQLAVLIHEQATSVKTSLRASNLLTVVPTFLGNYVVGFAVRAGAYHGLLVLGGALTIALVAWAIVRERTHVMPLVIIVYFWFVSIALSTARVDIGVLDPVHAGPRYFFYPFIFEGWLLIHIFLKSSERWVRVAATTFLMLAFVGASNALSRSHDDLHWSQHLYACADGAPSSAYRVPIQFDGNASLAWGLVLTGAQCRSLVDRDAVVRAAPALVPRTVP